MWYMLLSPLAAPDSLITGVNQKDGLLAPGADQTNSGTSSNAQSDRRSAMSGNAPINPFSKYQRHTLLGAAKLLAVSRSTIERLRDNGELKGWQQFGRRWYTDGASIKEYLDRNGGGEGV
jgi:excisionase family DNA binding protein